MLEAQICKSLLDWEPVSDRIMTARLHTPEHHLYKYYYYYYYYRTVMWFLFILIIHVALIVECLARCVLCVCLSVGVSFVYVCL